MFSPKFRREPPDAAVLLAAVAVLALTAVLWYGWATWGVDYVWALRSSEPGRARPSLEDAARVGQMFGGVGTLFAALAFAGVGFAVWLQHRTWMLHAEQSRRQSFEPLFFALLARHQELRDRLQLWSMEPELASRRLREGRRGLEDLAGELREALCANDARSRADGGARDRLAELVSTYNRVYWRNENELGPYFRSLYHVFKLIDQSAPDAETRVRYANIARADLGADEVFLLAINGLAPRAERFRALIEAYGLLKHVRRRTERGDAAPDHRLVQPHYAASAFQTQEDREVPEVGVSSRARPQVADAL